MTNVYYLDSTTRPSRSPSLGPSGPQAPVSGSSSPKLSNTAPAKTGHQCSDRSHVENISPIGLYLDASYWDNRNVDILDMTTEIDAVVKQLYRQHSSLSRRPITLILLKGLFRLLSATDTTQLMYLLGRHFHLCTQANREYCVEIEFPLRDLDQLALMKGLGFNQLMLSPIAVQDMAETLHLTPCRRIPPCVKVTELQEFHFNKIIFNLSNDIIDNSANAADLLRAVLRHWQPDRILYDQRFRTIPHQQPQPALQALDQEHLPLLLQREGYEAIGSYWVKTGDPLLATGQNSRLSISPLGYNTVNVREIISLA